MNGGTQDICRFLTDRSTLENIRFRASTATKTDRMMERMNEQMLKYIHQTENITKVKDFTLSEKLENARKCRVLSFLNGNAQTFLAVIPK